MTARLLLLSFSREALAAATHATAAGVGHHGSGAHASDDLRVLRLAHLGCGWPALMPQLRGYPARPRPEQLTMPN
jgi:hypothetical protein